MSFRHVRSKLDKNNVLATSKRLSGHILETVGYSLPDLQRMVDVYGSVYVKPDNLGAGKGIIKVPNEYDLASADKHVCTNSDKGFIIQQSIDSLTTVYGMDIGIEGNIFDTRVIVMLLHGKWERVYMFAKTAQQGGFVSSPERGGMRVKYDLAVHGAGLNRRQSLKLKERLYSISILAAKVLEKHYPGIMIIGFDIGIDKKLNPWIIEANTRPRIDMLIEWTDSDERERMRGYCKYLHEYQGEHDNQVGLFKVDRKLVYNT
jgi:hypothetical protein